ncbi:MAG: YafY family transcriptional regulator [Actinomycetia bacterium]|nr:YafY family transcriptional regulator [Actinomycetes bacterium]
MRASRLLSILIMLQLKGRVTAEALAQEFEVSVRTIYRDMDQLSAAGVPVYADRGPGGGFALLAGYRTQLTGLDGGQAEAMFLIGMPGPAQALGLGTAAAQAGQKLLAALPPGASAEAGRIGARFHLDPVDWYHDAEPTPDLPVIARAVLDGQRLAMTYDSWTAVRSWTVDPLGLVLKAGLWYLVAHGAEKTRIFRVSNMRDVRVEDSRFDRPADFDLSAFWSAELTRFEGSLRQQTAVLRVSALGLKRLAALGAYAREAVASATAADAMGWAELQFPYENADQLALALLGIGAEVEVIEPLEVREGLKTLASGVVALAATAQRRKRSSLQSVKPLT